MAKHREKQPEDRQPLVALAFRQDGRLLCKGAFKDGNTVYFDVETRALRQSRIFIGLKNGLKPRTLVRTFPIC